MQNLSGDISYRLAVGADLAALVAVENACFSNDKLSNRSFKRWLKADHAIMVVAECEASVIAYGLVWCHKGTRLARLYSLAVLPSMRGKGIAIELLAQLELLASEQNRLYMRLEVAKSNLNAIKLYELNGYRVFGEYSDYYEDHTDALRMQKRIRTLPRDQVQRLTPWYQQTTDFSCGPAALMMAMASLDSDLVMHQGLELDIWREATTIFMTSGLGGCHPVGLALAAAARGYQARVYLSSNKPLFVDGVRSLEKRDVMTLVHHQFIERAASRGVDIVYEEISQIVLRDCLLQGCAVLVLISTFRLDGKKAPHWVTVTGMDDTCLYVHDPDPDLENDIQLAIDCQYLPIALDDFEKMAAFGSSRLRTAVVLRPVTD